MVHGPQVFTYFITLISNSFISDEINPSLYMVWMKNLVRLLAESKSYDEAAISQCLLCAYILEIGQNLAHYITRRDKALAASENAVSPLLDTDFRCSITREIRADLEEQCEKCGWISSMRRILPTWKLHTPTVSLLYSLYHISFLYLLRKCHTFLYQKLSTF